MYTKAPKYLIDTEALKQAIFEKGYSVKDFCRKVCHIHTTSVYPKHGELYRETSQWAVDRLAKGLGITPEGFVEEFGTDAQAPHKRYTKRFASTNSKADKHGEVSIGSTVDTKQLVEAIKNTIVALQVYEAKDQNLYILANGLRKVLLGF